MKYIFFFSLMFFTSNAFSGASDSAKEAWDKTKEATNNAINVSKEVGGKALEASKQAYTSLSESSSHQETPEERFSEIWGDVLEYLDEGLTILQKTKSAPDSAFFKEDKKSLRKDFNEILDEIITLLNDPNIQDHRNEIDSLRNQITETRREITDYREKKVVAPRENMVKTTKSGYDQKIKAAEQDIIEFETQIEEIHLLLLERFKHIGLDLDLNQITVLLARVDSNNIIQMSAVFDVLKMITERFVELTQDSGGNVETARRYYGMQVILIETVIFMQNKYIEKMNNEYLPKLKVIVLDTVTLQRSTQQSISKTSEPNKKKVYNKNLEAQDLTLKVALLYMDQLKNQREKVVVAKNKMVGNLELAKNTYDTVEISAELMNLLNSNQESFDVIMSLQVPEIVPFENLEMKEEFQRLSMKMQEME